MLYLHPAFGQAAGVSPGTATLPNVIGASQPSVPTGNLQPGRIAGNGNVENLTDRGSTAPPLHAGNLGSGAGQSGYISTDTDSDMDSQSEPCEEVARQLSKNELVPPQGYGKTQESVKDIAILTLQLEEMRLKYARLLQLNAEGVTAANTLQTARAGYERVQVQLAGKVNNVKQVLRKIIEQRKLANDLQVSMAAAFGRRSQVAEIAPAKKPAPSEIPGKPPQPL